MIKEIHPFLLVIPSFFVLEVLYYYLLDWGRATNIVGIGAGTGVHVGTGSNVSEDVTKELVRVIGVSVQNVCLAEGPEGPQQLEYGGRRE